MSVKSFGSKHLNVSRKENSHVGDAVKHHPHNENSELISAKENDHINKEIVELKHKIRELTDEYDEIEDERDELESQLNKKKQELSEKENIVIELEYNTQKLKKEVRSLNDDLLEKTSDLESKQQALSFVQEVLKAPLVNDDEKRNKLEKAIQKLYDFIRDELQEYLESHEKEGYIEGDFSLPTIKGLLERWVVLERKTWIKGKVSIAFIGEFSAGKTSLVNRILSQDNPDTTLLPVSTKATTAIPTYISYNEAGSAFRFISPDNNLKKMKEKTFKAVTKAILDEVQGISSLMTYFVMEYNNEHLKNLSILDTPGFSSNDSEDAQRTIDVINECDALFWVFDVNAGTVNRKSIETIREHLRRPLHIVINKVDTKSEEDVKAVENLIRETLEKENLNVKAYHRFSNKEPISNIMTPIKELAKSGKEKDSFLDDLQKALSIIRGNIIKKRKSTLEEIKVLRDELKETQYTFNSILLGIELASTRLKEYPKLKDKSWFSSSKEYTLDKFSIDEIIRFLYSIEPKVNLLKEASNNIASLSKEIDSKEIEFRKMSSSFSESERVIEKLTSLIKELN